METDTYNSLGQYLRTTRKGLDLSLRAVEDATGNEVSNAYLSQIETGKITRPSLNTLHALARTYRISYEGLMTRAGYSIPTHGSKQGRKKGSSLSIDNLTQEEERALLEYLEFFRSRRK